MLLIKAQQGVFLKKHVRSYDIAMIGHLRIVGWIPSLTIWVTSSKTIAEVSISRQNKLVYKFGRSMPAS